MKYFIAYKKIAFYLMCLIKYTQSAPLVSYMLLVKVCEHAYDCCCCSNQCWGSSSFF